MRNCDNCNNGSYGLDCNSGIETLYCRESEYEYEVKSGDVCNSHQFIDGTGNEKHFVLYDESYLGKGYFIIHKKNGKIDQFLKIYIMYNMGYPNYGLRVFSIDGKDNPDKEFNIIQFIFRNQEDFDNGLFEAFSTFGKSVSNAIHTIDGNQQGRNHISISVENQV